MSHVAWSVCVWGTRVVCAKTAEPMKMPFGGLTLVGPRNHVLDGNPDRTNTFTALRVDKTTMRPLPDYFGHLFHRVSHQNVMIFCSSPGHTLQDEIVAVRCL